jgi:ComF family protein
MHPPLVYLRRVGAVLKALREAAFPARCLECRKFLPPVAEEAASSAPGLREPLGLLQPYFCRPCLEAVTPLESPFCPRCGVMFKGRAGSDHLCGRCLEQPPPFHMARSAFVYDGSLVDVIHCLKYKGKAQLARPLGILMYRAFVRFWEGEAVDLVLPVPLHGRRLRQRGFNQAGLLAAEWRKHLDRDAAIASGLLVRVRPTLPQAGLGLRGRESNIRGAFAVRNPEKIADRHVLVVDDVVTTGATVRECARLLLAHGARRVDVLALARVI